MKKKQSERLFGAIGGISDKYVDEAIGRDKKKTTLKRWIALAACFAIVVSLSLYLFIPLNDSPNISAYEGSDYYPVIAGIANYFYRPHNNKNNFEKLVAGLEKLLPSKALDNAMPEAGGASGTSPDGGIGDYFEVTDNQVAGVIEADLIKASSTHLYRVSNDDYILLRIYSIADGTDSTDPISSIKLTTPNDKSGIINHTAEMYLSDDLKTVTVISTVHDVHDRQSTAVYTVNVENPTNPTLTGVVTLSGGYNTSRKIGNQILVVTNHTLYGGDIDYNNPETYIPTVNDGNGNELVPMEDIVMPSVVSSARYSVLMLIDEGATEPTDTLALFNYTGALYVTENGVYAAQSYTEKARDYINRNMTEIAHVAFEDGLTLKGKMTAEGRVKDQYSLDERDGYLRVVTSTNFSERNGMLKFTDNASLYIFDLSDHSERRAVKYFAPDGEEARSVRFDGDKLYVCTAEVIKLTDPVYFFDLSDYDNISSTDTGTIDGYSDNLIQLGDGYLLGIGIDGNNDGKLEVYREEGGSVISTNVFVFDGDFSTEYKAYLINREAGIFGMQVNNLSYKNEEGRTVYVGNAYLIYGIENGEISILATVQCDTRFADRTRAFIKNGFVYISTDAPELLKWEITDYPVPPS